MKSLHLGACLASLLVIMPPSLVMAQAPAAPAGPPAFTAPSTDTDQVAAGRYEMDVHHTNIAARINHMGFSIVTVNFPKSTGSLTYDPAHPENSTLDVTTDVTALNSGFDMRDTHIKDKSFLNSGPFATIHFTANHLTKIDTTHARVDGEVTLLGVTKPLSLNVTFNGGGKGMMGDRRVGFLATGTINRSDFGMTGSLPAIGDKVDLLIDSEFALAK